MGNILTNKDTQLRIIRVAAALALLLGALVPQIAFGATESEAQDSNETKTNPETNIGFSLEGNVIVSPEVKLASDSDSFEGYAEPIKTEEDKKREEYLAQYASASHRDGLPEGKFTINVSAYTAAADECGKSDGKTASGLQVKEGETLACPPQFSFGTKVSIEGMGTYVCEDRGGAIKGNHFDIFMKRKADAFDFGRKHLLAEVVM